MKFQLFQKYNRKILIWSAATTLFITLISLLIIWAIPVPNNKEKAMISVQVVINDFFIWLLLIMSNRSRSWLQLLIQVDVYHDKQKINNINLSIKKSLYFWLLIFLGILWLIEITSFTLWTKSWIKAMNLYWWIPLIFFLVNYCYLSIFWAIQIYLYNHDSKIIKNLEDPKNRYPEN